MSLVAVVYGNGEWWWHWGESQGRRPRLRREMRR
jgi:hypothetical protein